MLYKYRVVSLQNHRPERPEVFLFDEVGKHHSEDGGGLRVGYSHHGPVTDRPPGTSAGRRFASGRAGIRVIDVRKVIGAGAPPLLGAFV